MIPLLLIIPLLSCGAGFIASDPDPNIPFDFGTCIPDPNFEPMVFIDPIFGTEIVSPFLGNFSIALLIIVIFVVVGLVAIGIFVGRKLRK